MSEKLKKPISKKEILDLVLLPSAFIPVLEHSMKESKFRAGFGFAGFLFVTPSGKTEPFLKIDSEILEIASLGFLVCSIVAFVRYLRASKLVFDARMFESLGKINPDADLNYYKFLTDKKNSQYELANTYSGGGTIMNLVDMVVGLSMLFAGMFLLMGVLGNLLSPGVVS